MALDYRKGCYDDTTQWGENKGSSHPGIGFARRCVWGNGRWWERPSTGITVAARLGQVMSRARMLALVLAVAVPLLAQENHRHSWAGVRAIPAGSRVLVSIADKTWVPPKVRRVKGELESADGDSVTVIITGSAVESIPKDSIVKLKVYQPPAKRLAAWIASGATGIFMLSGAYSQGSGSVDNEGLLILLAAGVTVPIGLVMFRATRFKTIYHAP